MARKTRFSIAQKDIVAFFDKQENSIFTKQKIAAIFQEQYEFWRLTASMKMDDFIQELIKTSFLKKHVFDFQNKKITLYTWKKFELYSLLTSLKPNAYLCYYTALHLHNLTEQIPKEYYISSLRASKIERPENLTIDTLTQEEIDAAFSKPKMGSNRVAIYDEAKIFLLESHHQEKIGITEMKLGNSLQAILVTDLERTLIDIVVRPFYSGGVYEILKAFRNCADRLSINKLSSYLNELDFLYPYHQVIGFYLENSGAYPETVLEKIQKRFPIKRKMYLVYGEKELSFSEKWGVYYPKYMGGFR